MSTGEPDLPTSLNDLLDEQKELYAKLAAVTSKEQAPASGKKPLLLEAFDNGTKMQSRTDVSDVFLYLHFLMFGGPYRIEEVSTTKHRGDSRQVAVHTASTVFGVLWEQDDDIRKWKQWDPAASDSDSKTVAAAAAATFRCKVAFAAYVLHTLKIRECALRATAPSADLDSDIRVKVKEKKCIEKIIEDRKPFEDELKEHYMAMGTENKEALDKACSGLCDKKLVPFPSGREMQGFKDAKNAFDKAKKLEQIWLNSFNLGICLPTKD